MKCNAKLKGKDLINIGIYAAIYCVIMTAVAMLGFIPIMMPMLCALVPLVGGIPMMLFMTKVDKFGMITIYSMIVGLFLWITGMGYWPFIFGIIFGLIADLIAKSGNYKSAAKTICSYAVFCLVIFGNFIPLFMNVKTYFATRQSFGEEYINTLSDIMSRTWIAPLLIVTCLVCGAIGGLIGKSLLKKHFVKAGIA